MRAAALAALIPVLPGSADAQIRGSERQRLTQTIGGVDVTLDYSRPSARGRDGLFGEVVHWEEVWTPGANDATLLSVSDDFELGGHEVDAGTYSVWIQVLEDADWVFMLHPDTTLFHTEHPTIDEGVLTFPVTPEESDHFTETLAFDLQSIRAGTADLTLRWGHTLVTVPLEVETGFVMTVDAETAERYDGTWTMAYPQSPNRTTRRIDFRYDAGSERLFGYQGGYDDDPPDLLLLPRAEGVFNTGYLSNGDLIYADESQFWEFTFDDDGRPVEFVGRNSNDEVWVRGTREDG